LRNLPLGLGVPLLLWDDRYSDVALGRREVAALDADAFLPAPLDREGVEKAIGTATETWNKRSYIQRQASGGEPPGEPEGRAAFVARLERFWRESEGMDHYQVLGLPPAAHPRKIKDAYFARALEFHPDRLGAPEAGDLPLREMAYETTKRLGEAFQVLSDPDRRGAYDAELARRRLDDAAVPGRPPQVSLWLEEAGVAERSGKLADARGLLARALELAPGDEEVARRLDAVIARLSRPGTP
jgi:hypothetical protein